MNFTSRVSVLVFAAAMLSCAASSGDSPPPSAPVITTHPANQIVAAGERATFAVAATGSGSLSYLWSRDGAALTGETAATLTTAPATVEDADAAFTVTVSDAHGNSIRSHAATLRIEGFRSAPAMIQTRQGHTATRLASGQIFLAGGYSSGPLSSTEIYDPVARAFTASGAMLAARQNHTATLLPGGKVVLIGGQGGAGGGTALFSAETYDPATGLFAPAGNMLAARYLHTATLLPGGKVLVAGGLWGASNRPTALDGAEIFDPASGTFSAVGSMATTRYYHTATPLPGGQVLVTGGIGAAGRADDTAEVYDPAAATFSSGGTLSEARYAHSATLLPGGQVLLAGGYGSTFLSSAEVYDAAAATFTATGSMASVRQFHTAVGLASGKILVAGGAGVSDALASAEIYDPAAATFDAAGDLSEARYFNTISLLDDGDVLVAGGWTMDGAGTCGAELYTAAP